ncbi:MAG: ABC transporter substrate-binding protein [Oscillospiraceae bacterium]|jgi:glucose/mannose transport system substrate-binding protein|nr:ABC transporter substrate-binding protein [Oscillospiraceae bacterium]
MKKKFLKVVAAAITALLALPSANAIAAKNAKVESLDTQAALSDTTAGGKLNIYHWWTAGGEKEAIEAAIGGFLGMYPSVDPVSNAIPGGAGGAMVMKVKVLALSGKSPETFQAHPGMEIQPYLESDILFDLSGLWEYAGLEDRMLEGVAELCQVDGKYYIVPIGAHKTNTIFYNKRMFDEYGVTPPSDDVTWEQLWAVCDELTAKLPDGKYPFDLGDRKGWPATQAFESIMMGVDPQIYEDFINGRATAAQVQSALDIFKKMMEYVAPDHTARLWYEAAGRVVAGDYAMMMMGTWMQPFMTNQGWVYGEDYGVFSVPGTQGYYGFCVDGFVVPNDSASVENGLRWVYAISDPETQTGFTRAKESVSPYKDTPDEVYSELAKAFKDELVNPDTVVYPSFTHGTALPWAASTDLHSRLSDFTTSADPDTARYAKMITEALNEAGVEGDWDIVK